MADDEPIVLSLAKTILHSHGYQVLLARNGHEALAVPRDSGPFDLLLTDVVMPLMTGPQLIREHGADDTGCDFLRKPFTPESLLKKVRATLDAPA